MNYKKCPIRKMQKEAKIWSVAKYGCSGATDIEDCEQCEYYEPR